MEIEIESAIWGPEVARRACRGTFGRTLVGRRSGRHAEGERRGENAEHPKRARLHLRPETYSRISVCTSTAEATIHHFVCALPHLKRGVESKRANARKKRPIRVNIHASGLARLRN